MNPPASTIDLRLDLGEARTEALRFARNNREVLLRDFVRTYPARSPAPIPPEYLDRPIGDFLLSPVTIRDGGSAVTAPAAPPAGQLRLTLDKLFDADLVRAAPPTFPDQISENEAVQIAYRDDLQKIARYLKNDLSVLIVCDKTLTEHVYEFVCNSAGRHFVLDDAVPARSNDLQRALQGNPGPEATLPILLRNLRANQILVLRGLDTLDSPPLIEALYHGRGRHKPQLLGFLDPSLKVRKVLTDRFAVHHTIMGLPRFTQARAGEPPAHTVTQLITRHERECFEQLDAEQLHKHVSGLNAVQFRNAMRYVGATVSPGTDSRGIYEELRKFKTSSSEEVEAPQTRFEEIGGYERLKQELKKVIDLVAGRVPGLSERQREQLIPRGFVFHGPPGTGKTLFAKAIANEMHATIQMVSGPEIMDKYVGQSESNLRHIFATARRNAPSVIFFDEFDSIASQRSSYSFDGGSRANNAVVAQLLTELDGFRHDQAPVLVIGTSNRISDIDEALLRPSRLRPILIDRPDDDARRSVVRIHGEAFGIDQMMCEQGRLALEHLAGWGQGDPVPPAFVAAILARYPHLVARSEAERRRADFVGEVRGLLELVSKGTSRSADSAARREALAPIERRLRELAEAHGTTQDDPAERQIQEELRDLFEVVAQQRQQAFSPEQFWETILDLVAEYTRGFNNDEIRALFQEASLDHHVEGRLITPRDLGLKLGLIKKRRDERELVHLQPAERRR